MGKSNPPHHPQAGSSRAPEYGDRPRSGSIAQAKAKWKTWGAIVATYVLTVFFLTPLPRLIPLAPGKPLPAEVRAPDNLEVVDVDANQTARENLRQHYARTWAYLPAVRSRAVERLRQGFEVLLAYHPETGSDVQKISDELYRKAEIRLKNEDLEALFKDINLRQMRDHLVTAANRTLGSKLIVNDKGLFNAHRSVARINLRGVPAEFLSRFQDEEPLGWPTDARRHLSETELREFYPSGAQRPEAELAVKILMQVITPNLEYDRETSESKLNEQLAALEKNPVMKTYEKGEIIARRGDKIGESLLPTLVDVNSLRRRNFLTSVVGVLLMTFTCFAAAGLYLSRMRGAVAFTAGNVTMMALPILLVMGIGRLTDLLDVLPQFQWVFFPTSLVGMLSAIMIGPQVGFILVLLCGVLYGLATGQNLDFQVFSMFGGFMAVVSLQSIRERKDVMTAGMRVGVVNVATVCILALFRIPAKPDPPLVFWAFVNGLTCAAATLPLMVIFERAFGVVTDIRLLEITGPQHPLMRMLEEKAPGTYQHVLNVTKLAESAAESIGANFLLVRAGAYFHDVGKMLKPKYFSENQVTFDDKKSHSRLSPYMSTLIIKNHVKEGMEMAKKFGLPDKVIDFIPQHHGTGLIRYFYSEALQRYEETERTDVVREEDFRYPGPKPQTIEAAIVLLADSTEAIATSVFTQPQVNENDLRRVVAQAVSERFNDGQFDECDLTMRDLFQIRESFIKTLKARFHHRIAYPAQVRKEAPREPSSPALAPAAS